jgi:hypothetical protein
MQGKKAALTLRAFKDTTFLTGSKSTVNVTVECSIAGPTKVVVGLDVFLDGLATKCEVQC